jgi:CRP/FNR family cyclic AMP-dependent transcriptional regulator
VSYRTDPRAQQYGSLELFAGCSPRDLRTLARTSTRIDVPAGKVLARQGAHRPELCLVVGGGADVVRDGSVVDHLRAGDHHGEFTLLRGVPQPTTLVATEPTVVDVFTAPEFLGAYRTMPSLRAAIDRNLDRRTATWLTVPTAALALAVSPTFAEC